MGNDDTTVKQRLPLPPIGTRLRDLQRVEWSVDAHENGCARLSAVADPGVTRTATAERLADFAVVRKART